MSSEKFYITTAIAYVNGRPHIGHAMEMIQADALARYNRLLGNDTHYLTGTDEFGSKIYQTAQEAGMQTQDFVDQNALVFVELTKKLNISNDQFIRTSSSNHQAGAQKLWKILEANDDIYKDSYEGLYCVGCEAFINEKDLLDGNCPTHKKPPEKLKEENYFFRLSRYNEQIKQLIQSDQLKIYPEARKNEILALIEKGLNDISFSRPKSALPWGVTVPNDENHVMYVWCDALSNYITALGFAENSDLYKKFWPANLQIIGKDILRFHAGVWIGMLLSANLPLPKAIGVHGFVTSEGHKMSKSLGNVVDPFTIQEEFGTDALRYYLLREIPTTDDGDFSQHRFQEIYDSELANSIGNLVSRTLAMLHKYNEGKVTAKPLSNETEKAITKCWEAYTNKINQFDIKKAIEAILALADYANQFIEQSKPWQAVKNGDTDSAITSLSEIVEVIRHLGLLLLPIIPESSQKIINYLNYKLQNDLETEKQSRLPNNHLVQAVEPIFPRIISKENV